MCPSATIVSTRNFWALANSFLAPFLFFGPLQIFLFCLNNEEIREKKHVFRVKTHRKLDQKGVFRENSDWPVFAQNSCTLQRRPEVPFWDVRKNVRKKRHDVKRCLKSRFRNVDPKAAWKMS